MKPGDLIQNKYTLTTGLIIGRTCWHMNGYGYGEYMEFKDYELLLCRENKKMVVPCQILEEHWEKIDEN